MKRTIAVFGMTRLSVPQKVERARFIVASMTGNANFPAPIPALAVITANVDSLEVAALAAKAGGKDDVAAMRVKSIMLELSLKTLCTYVEAIANTDYLTAGSVVLSAGFAVKKPSPPKPNGFRIARGKDPGELDIRTDAVPRSFYLFEMTLTPDVEESWEKVYGGMRSRFLVTGLESGKRYYFRVSRTDRHGAGPWSNVLNLIAA